MTVEFRNKSVFDAETVCPGDILLRKGTDVYYFVVESNLETEEFLCVRGGDGGLKNNIVRIGYEKADLFTKINLYDASSK